MAHLNTESYQPFEDERRNLISEQSNNQVLISSGKTFLQESVNSKYSYNFNWLGRPIIQYPQDIVAAQEIVYSSEPDCIIETGIAHGGSLVMSASMLALLDMKQGVSPEKSKRKVIGVDIDIRQHNREYIENHFLSSYITLVEGSSIDNKIASKVKHISKQYNSVMVMLDSNHTHEHVLSELELYGDLVSLGNYLIVYDTLIEDMPANAYPNRSWGPGNNPKTAVQSFLSKHNYFEIDTKIDSKLVISVAKHGYLKRIA